LPEKQKDKKHMNKINIKETATLPAAMVAAVAGAAVAGAKRKAEQFLLPAVKAESAAERTVRLVEEVQVASIQKLGTEIIRATASTGEKYLDLCRYVRINEVEIKVVSRELGALGFARPRISEIITVAMSSDATWKEFEARTIGMRCVLELERGNIVNLIAEVSGISETEVRSDVDEAKVKTGGATGGASGEAQETSARSLELALARVLKLAEKMKLRKKTAAANGYSVTVTKKKGREASVKVKDGDPGF
jgi:hypothetical protein